ncbi:MAG TPA: hypothetical protein GXX29_07985 [Firmicutes bacterium]|nr:hypothetical protein [Bacillota bacterium]
MKGKERRLYPGGNTSVGFFSYYDYITSPQAARVVILKGGPGVGKSTIMKWIGRAMQERGFDVEYLHCSSDSASLDGIRVLDPEIALIDGTAPHIIDPKHPGVIDEIVHLGDFWDEAAMRPEKEAVLMINQEISRAYKRAYRFLAAAKCLYDEIEAVSQVTFNPGTANQIYQAVLADFLGNRRAGMKPGRIRHLFASAITPTGTENQLSNLVDFLPHKIIIKGVPGSGKSTLVERLVNAASERGFYCEAFHCAFDPYKYEHAVFPDLGTALITSHPPHTYISSGHSRVVDMNTCLDTTYLVDQEPRLGELYGLYDQLFSKALSSLAEAKYWHDELEKHYIPHMDFHRINAYRETLLQRLLHYAEEHRNGNR